MTEFQKPEQSGQAAALPKTYAQHPLSAASLPMTAQEFQELKDSIENIGPMSPVVIADGMVLHGWGIYRACLELDMDFPVQELPAHIAPQDYLNAQNIGHKAQANPSSAKHQRIPLRLLRSSAQPRPITPSDVDKLAASIRELGLIQPISVRPALVTGNITEYGFQIVAGHHRVAAVRALGWTEIDAIVVQTKTSIEAELIEIDENLVRSELTPAQRAHYTARRAEIREALAPYVTPEAYQDGGGAGLEVATKYPPQVHSHGGARPQTKAFAAETAALTGESKSSINQYRAIGEALGDDALRLSGTSLDKKAELTALAKMPEPQRKDLIERAQTGEKVTARTVSVVPPPKTSHPDAWDNAPQGDTSTLPEGMTEADFGPSEEEMAEAMEHEAAEKAKRELLEKMIESDDQMATLFAEAKMLKAQVARLERYRDELMNKAHAIEQIAKKRDRENLRLRKELDALRGKGGAQ
ncbi:MAG: ParB N-terminal domain-containing protein [Burkholderiaceae bacterium]|nr:ParB N-terminal domain-containing protein [Burkholderiaceae bacterium]